MNNLYKLITLFAVNIFVSLDLHAALPENISELVEESAPAVVNITSKKEISQRQSFGYGGIPDEMLERFGYLDSFVKCRKKKERQFLMDLVSY